MIYSPSHSLFIHIPRTSGISLVTTAMRAIQNVEDSGMTFITCGPLGRFRRHARAVELSDMFVNDEFVKWSIMRNPWRMCESMYRHFHHKLQMIESGKSCFGVDGEDYKVCLHWCSKSFEEFVVTHYQYLQHGFWHHWCCGETPSDDLGVQPFLYEDLSSPEIWNCVCDLLRVPHGTRRAMVNRAEPDVSLEWTRKSIDFIRDRCKDDIERFGYASCPDS